MLQEATTTKEQNHYIFCTKSSGNTTVTQNVVTEPTEKQHQTV
jgi:hypothetical protein